MLSPWVQSQPVSQGVLEVSIWMGQGGPGYDMGLGSLLPTPPCHGVASPLLKHAGCGVAGQGSGLGSWDFPEIL